MRKVEKTFAIRKNTFLDLGNFLRKNSIYRDKDNRRETPEQLNDFVILGGSFFNTPSKVIHSLRATTTNFSMSQIQEPWNS